MFGVVVLALGLAAGLAALSWRTATRSAQPVASAAAATYVGGQTCAGCHREQYESWKTSDHALAMQPADGKTVLGNFDNARFTKDGVTSIFFTREGQYFVRTDGPDGALRDYRIAYTFGVKPLQQYLIEFPRGRYQALSIAWDSRPAAGGGQRWFYLYPGERIHHGDVLHWTGLLQNWNYMCADCHSTNLQKNYRLAEDRYDTTWTDVNVSCEACHGPGSRHVAWAQPGPAGRANGDPARGLVVNLKDAPGNRWTLAPGESIARRTVPLATRAEVEACGRCHARRAPVGGDVLPGQPLEQTYRVSLLESPRYHADGQIRDEVYEYGSFLQSAMYRAGVTCSNCHDPHTARLRAEGNAVCAQCHLTAKYDGPRHTFHQAGTEGARCVSCHMPQRHYMVVDGRRDHSFRVPRPDLSQTLGTPNACTDCHKNRSPAWAAETVARWYGPARRGGWHYAEALHAGQTARPDAERQLLRASRYHAEQPYVFRVGDQEYRVSYLPAESDTGMFGGNSNWSGADLDACQRADHPRPAAVLHVLRLASRVPGRHRPCHAPEKLPGRGVDPRGGRVRFRMDAGQRGIVPRDSTWYAVSDGAGQHLTAAGRWHIHVSIPIFQFLLLR